MNTSLQIQSKFSRQDFFVLIVLILFGIFISFIIYKPAKDISKIKYLEVRQNGIIIMKLPTNENTVKQITGSDGNSTNTFTIDNGIVQMTEANCHDSTCIRTGSISHVGETIVCLPHRLVLKIVSDNAENTDEHIDAIVK